MGNHDRIVEAFAPWRSAKRRPAWHPQFAESPSGSHFGGIPSLLQEETWPACRSCRRPLPLVAQVQLDRLPEDFPGPKQGVFQFFCCCGEPPCMAETFEPFNNDAKVLRIVPAALLKQKPDLPEGAEPWPAKYISGWKRFDDYPDPAEHERLGVTCQYDFAGGQTHTTVLCPSHNLRFERVRDDQNGPGVAEAIATAAGGDKLGGWPHWIQGVEYPNCPRCGSQMSYLLQIDSNDSIPYMWGDLGCGHVSFCRQHPDVIAFAWACA